MAIPDLHRCVPAALSSLADDLRGSFVLLDAGSAEAIAAAAGLQLLSDMGAVSVGDLRSPTLPRDAAAAAALAGGKLASLVIFVSTLLGPAEASIRAACAAAAPFTSPQLTVACANSPAAHHDEAPAIYGPEFSYADFCAAATGRLAAESGGKLDFHISAKLCPLLAIPLGDSAFVLPARGGTGAAGAGGRVLGYSAEIRAVDSDDDENPAAALMPLPSSRAATPTSRPVEEKPRGVAVLAHALTHLAASLGHRPEAFCLGPAAAAVGRAMSYVPPIVPPGADHPPSTPAAFVLVDRGADLVTPSLHADLLMQRVWEVLATGTASSGGGVDDTVPFSLERDSDRGSSNAAFGFTPATLPVDMARHGSGASAGDGASSDVKSDFFSPLCAGSLFHPHDPAAAANLGFLLTRPGRDAGMFVRKWLREAARKDGVKPPQQLPGGARARPGGAVGAAELDALAAALAATPAAARRTAPLLQLATAAAAALEEGPAARWDALAKEERALTAVCADGGAQVACEQIIDVLDAAGREVSPVGLLEATGLLLIAFLVLPDHVPWFAADRGGGGGAFSAEQETRMRGALADAVLACSQRWKGKEGVEAASKDAPWLPQPLMERLITKDGVGDSDDDYNSMLRGLRLEVRDATGELFARLRELSTLRQRTNGAVRRGAGAADAPDDHRRHSSAAATAAAAAAARDEDGATQPLLVRLAGAVADRKEVAGLAHASTSLTGLLMSGLGRIGFHKRPRPGDYSLVVIFVIGGVSVSEIHEVLACVDMKAAAAAAAGIGGISEGLHEPGAGGGGSVAPPKVLVGGTALLQPRDAVAHAVACRQSGSSSSSVIS